jgi:hypothetical protein
VIQRYVQKVPGGRPHLPVDLHRPIGAFKTIAPTTRYLGSSRSRRSAESAARQQRRRRSPPWTEESRTPVQSRPAGPATVSSKMSIRPARLLAPDVVRRQHGA